MPHVVHKTTQEVPSESHAHVIELMQRPKPLPSKKETPPEEEKDRLTPSAHVKNRFQL
jgi:hypothetical protein